MESSRQDLFIDTVVDRFVSFKITFVILIISFSSRLTFTAKTVIGLHKEGFIFTVLRKQINQR